MNSELYCHAILPHFTPKKKGKRCTHSGCNKLAQGATEYCAGHGGGKRCTHSGCNKLARGATECCIEHGGGKRCTHSGCNKSAQGATEYCAGHGGGKRCTHSGCNKLACGATEYCAGHGGGVRCPHCKDWSDSQLGCKKYDGYCARCFKREFPSDPRSEIIYEKTCEIAVRNYLITHHMNGFIHNIPIYTGNCDCTHKRRIDFRMLIGGTMLAVEVDERQHSGYNKHDEEIRYDDLYMVFSGKWIFVRFNTDAYKDIHGNRKNQELNKRLPVLHTEIERQIKRIETEENTELVEIYQLYYNGYKSQDTM